MAEEVQAGSNIVISAIAYSELLYGATKPKAPKRLKDMLDEFIGGIDSILPLSAEAVEIGAKIQQDLQRKGVQIGHNDSLIAGHAIATNCICVTNNMREFARVSGLALENWV